jgi:small subunit ribosomal protein S21
LDPDPEGGEANRVSPSLANVAGQEFEINEASDTVPDRPIRASVQASILRRVWFVVKLRLRDNESVNEAVRRFRKLVEHAGVKKEMRKREFYEKPSDIRRRDRRRAEMRARRANQPPELEAT